MPKLYRHQIVLNQLSKNPKEFIKLLQRYFQKVAKEINKLLKTQLYSARCCTIWSLLTPVHHGSHKGYSTAIVSTDDELPYTLHEAPSVPFDQEQHRIELPRYQMAHTTITLNPEVRRDEQPCGTRRSLTQRVPHNFETDSSTYFQLMGVTGTNQTGSTGQQVDDLINGAIIHALTQKQLLTDQKELEPNGEKKHFSLRRKAHHFKYSCKKLLGNLVNSH
ncbi:unnamed protein product [Ambrosiozyma monospora]|uniref:Unnamed protein product n=1 Tax=Ambrosiozyma monospora TaxID=43982 RepID=A0ACB5TCG0_AMBMO|nr:unnamed protein product [Ambrosiozyma monospora]